MKIEQRKIDELIPYAQNQKTHDERQIKNVANSIKRFGWQQPIVIDKNGVVVIGHCRLLAAKSLNLKEVPVTVADNLSEDEIRELRIADNKTNESPWDLNFLANDIKELDFKGFDFDFELRNEQDEEEQETYTSKVKIPQYEIKGEKPRLTELFDDEKTKALIEEIEQEEIIPEIKNFLKLAAYRHTVFNYRKIAEYYANAPENIQKLMERSALVIIDIEDAIANGYAKLRDEIAELMKGQEE